MASKPYYRAFTDALLSTKLDRLQLDLCRPPIQGYHGILTTTRIQYNNDPINLLGRAQEFTFELPDKRMELSLQLYPNCRDHYRLFCYTTKGMLFSVNLTLLRKKNHVFTIEQRIRLISRGISAKERSDRTAQLCATLTHLGLEVEKQRLVLGTFDVEKRCFIDTTTQAFLRDFTLASLLKGHFMGNKDYSLPGLPKFSPQVAEVRTAATAGRIIRLSMRYRVLEAARGRCVLCGRVAKDGVKIHVDHVKPFSKGGKTEFSNLQALCNECNLGKGNRSEVRFG